MTTKHARLASAVADAMLAQGFTQKQVATAAGITQSALCQALSGKFDIKEERWKMICENLGLCYEDVIADPVEEAASSVSPQAAASSIGDGASMRKEADASYEETRGGTAVPLSMEETEAETFSEDERRLFDVTMRYIAGHLKEDIRKGMDISLEDLYILLDVCKKMQAVAEAGSSDD